jgi:flagellar hook-associated protein 3 FlgL
MRISTSSIFEGASARLTNLQAKMDRIAQQVSTGRRILTPSDDPVAAARSLETQQSASINDQFAKNRLAVKNTLSIAEGTMGSMVDTLQSVHEQIINAGNGVLSDADRSYIANTLQGQLDQLVSLANSTDGAGNYVFAGHQTGQPPYKSVVEASTGVTTIQYNGDDGQRWVQVDTARKMPVNFVGEQLFPKFAQGPSGAKDIFKDLQDTIKLLRTPGVSSSERQLQLTSVGQNFDRTLQAVNDQRSMVGVHLQQLDELDSVGSDRANNYAQTLAALQDLDYNQALSDLSRQQLALQAAQKSFQQTSSLSLFNYIN